MAATKKASFVSQAFACAQIYVVSVLDKRLFTLELANSGRQLHSFDVSIAVHFHSAASTKNITSYPHMGKTPLKIDNNL